MSDHEMNPQQAPADPHPRRPAAARVALCACLVVLGGLGLQACGGSVSEAVPKSTPNIVPPSDTSAEKAALSTTSTSTTSTSKTSTNGETTSTGSSGEASSESSEASSGGTSEAGSSGGSSAGGEKASTPDTTTKST
jgi:uncharacterized membrane protein YgcG